MPKIEEIWAFIAEEGPDDEGLCAFKLGDSWLPLVGADKARIESLKPMAERIAKTTGKEILLAKFSVRTDVQVIR